MREEFEVRRITQFISATVAASLLVLFLVKMRSLTDRQRKMLIAPMIYALFVATFYLIVFANSLAIIDIPIMGMSAGLHLFGLITATLGYFSLMKFVK